MNGDAVQSPLSYFSWKEMVAPAVFEAIQKAYYLKYHYFWLLPLKAHTAVFSLEPYPLSRAKKW